MNINRVGGLLVALSVLEAIAVTVHSYGPRFDLFGLRDVAAWLCNGLFYVFPNSAYLFVFGAPTEFLRLVYLVIAVCTLTPLAYATGAVFSKVAGKVGSIATVAIYALISVAAYSATTYLFV
jgi:hypothetical protein